jgi:ATP-binding cassette subfamily B (MDR/TAP) protein 1
MDIIFALIFFLGAVFLYNHNLEISDVFTAIYANYYTGLTIGNYSQFMPDAMNAKNAAANIFELLDSEDEDQLQIKEGSNILSMPIRGNIVFKNISFKY